MYSEFKFVSTYNLAAHVRDKIIDNEPLEYVSDFFDINSQIPQYLKQSKTTLLHDFIHQEFVEGVYYLDRKLASDSLDEWKNYLDIYKIGYPTYKEFVTAKGNYNESDDVDESYYADQYSEKLSEIVVEKVSAHVVNETFSILFRDRKLLMEFNKLLADQITKLKQVDYPALLDKDGIVKRCAYWPDWVKRALNFRDQGSCAICLSDISGLLNVKFEKAIDHIVPLKLGGTNDITNLQLLCKSCNLDKLDHTIKTSDYYSGYIR